MDVLRLTLRQLQIFVAVARTGSTTAAADDIALSQSATSAAIGELERLLSVRVFDRVGKRLLLNDNGRALLPRACALLDGAAQIEQMAHGHDHQLQALRIGASMTLADHLLPDVLAALLGDRPKTSATWRSGVVVGNTASICARVAAFELDIGLIEGPTQEPSLRAEPWVADEMVVVAAPSLLAQMAGPARHRGKAARTSPVPVAALREAVWLVREPGSGTREANDQALLPHLGERRRTIQLGSNEAIQRAAAAGLGVACLSKWVVRDPVAAGRLVTVPVPWPAIVRRCHWVVHRDKPWTAAMQRVVEVLRAVGMA